MPEKDYAAETKDLERRADDQAPGVLELLDLYGRSNAPAEAWQPVNQGVVRQASTSLPSVSHDPQG
jgi:hypothetical protein